MPKPPAGLLVPNPPAGLAAAPKPPLPNAEVVCALPKGLAGAAPKPGADAPNPGVEAALPKAEPPPNAGVEDGWPNGLAAGAPNPPEGAPKGEDATVGLAPNPPPPPPPKGELPPKAGCEAAPNPGCWLPNIPPLAGAPNGEPCAAFACNSRVSTSVRYSLQVSALRFA